MFGVFVLLVGILAALTGFLGAMFLNNSSSDLTIAVNDAQYVLEQIRGLDYTSCIRYLPSACFTLPTFTNLPQETIIFDPAPTAIGSDMRKITVKVSWLDKGQTRSFSLASYFSR
jgi:hypothetical protein